MELKDIEVSNLDLKSPRSLSLLIIKYLCDEEYYPKLFEKDEESLSILINNVEKRGMDFRQFNELMLLLNQDIVSGDFFNFFFKKERITLDDLKQGVIRFRGFAMLCFGNFRFAYKQLIQMSKNELENKLSPYWRNHSKLKKEFENRPRKMLEIEKIPKEKTWYLGYVSGKKVDKQVEVMEKEEKKDKDFLRFRERLYKIGFEIEEAQEKAFRNSDTYLTWNCIDIYFATSMREKWEYEETYDFVKDVIGNGRLRKFKLRCFDPTQSKCANSREKGLIEGLMLKRALCTIYLAQESDTMGKDSELAATLAQSKPVIAYVPKHDPEKYSQKIRKHPLNYFKKRLLILDAEESLTGILEDPAYEKRLKKSDPTFEDTINRFLIELEEYRVGQPYDFWIEKEQEFKEKCEVFPKICEILALLECYNFDQRAKLLKGIHPLSMQVDLQTGVANGVLVVRSPKECAELLYRILTNEMKFSIRHDPDGFTILEETISESPFRVVIEHEKLTNSFWNLFFSN